MKTTILDKIDKKIIKLFIREQCLLSITRIADMTLISWITVRKHLNSLMKHEVIVKNGNKYELNPVLMNEIL